MIEKYLVDTSAFVRLHRNVDIRELWRDTAKAGLISICPITELELCYSARSSLDRDRLVTDIQETYSWAQMPDRVFQRASQVQHMLADKGIHRSAGPVDLLVAATAELNGMTLLHYDRDFDGVAQVTGQVTRWLALPGSIP